MRERRRVHAGTVVLDGQAHIMPWPKRAVGERSFGGELRGLECHLQGAARAHGLDRVAAQIHHHLVQLGGIADHDERQLRGACLQTNGGGKQPA